VTEKTVTEKAAAAADDAASAVGDAAESAARTTADAASSAGDATREAADKAMDKATATAERAAEKVTAPTPASSAAASAADKADQAGTAVSKAAGKAADKAGATVDKATDKAAGKAAEEPTPPPVRSLDEIEAELDETRARLAERLDALADYVTPRNLVGRQVDKVKRVFVDEYGGIKPEPILIGVGVVAAIVGIRLLRRRGRD
jgi:hypothetical protein